MIAAEKTPSRNVLGGVLMTSPITPIGDASNETRHRTPLLRQSEFNRMIRDKTDSQTHRGEDVRRNLFSQPSKVCSNSCTVKTFKHNLIFFHK